MKELRAAFLVLAVSACLGACVDIGPEIPSEGAGAGLRPNEVQGLDPGAKSLTSLHFEVHAYTFETTRIVSDYSERIYNRVITDTGLDSFRPRQLYPIYIYASREEFHRKTGLPEWSAGAADGTAIYTFEGPHLKWVLPHELTHLVFAEYMGIQTHAHKWLNEGLAVYEEQEAAPGEAPSRIGGTQIPFHAMVTLTPLSEKDRQVSAWYHQVGSVVRFMIERSRGPGFQLFLRALRDGKTVDEAVSAAYPGQWRDLKDVERSWGNLR
jgi:hypothetical protein